MVAVGTLAVVVWYLGIGPFLDGIRAVDRAALVIGAGIGVLTTFCCAWRWTTVARGLGLRLSFPAAVAACYRSVFLNLTLPGGVVGDVHRGVSHGRNVRDVGLALRAVAWERTAGQVVEAVVTVAVLVALPSPVRPSTPLVVGVLVAVVIAVALLGRARPGHVRRRDSGPRRAGRRRRRSLRSRPVLRNCRARSVHHARARLLLSRRGLELQRRRDRP